MTHTPCESCKNSVGGVDCRLNVEDECREGGGYEAFEPSPATPPKPSRSERFLKWSSIVLSWIAYTAIICRIVIYFARK